MFAPPIRAIKNQIDKSEAVLYADGERTFFLTRNIRKTPMINNPNSDMKIANGSHTTNSVDSAESGSIIEKYKEAIPPPPIIIPGNPNNRRMARIKITGAGSDVKSLSG